MNLVLTKKKCTIAFGVSSPKAAPGCEWDRSRSVTGVSRRAGGGGRRVRVKRRRGRTSPMMEASGRCGGRKGRVTDGRGGDHD